MIDFYNLSLMTKLTNLYILYKICKLHINYIEGENMNISMYTYQKQIERIYRKLNHRSTGFLRPYYEKYQISELQYRVLSHIQERHTFHCLKADHKISITDCHYTIDYIPSKYCKTFAVKM